MNRFGYFAANSLRLAANAKAAVRFGRALGDPRAAQERILFSLLRRNSESEYGRRHGFHRLVSVRDYQDCVPVVTFDALRADIEAIKHGRRAVLTDEPVLMFEKTSGSSGTAKYIPYTNRLKEEFQAAIAPWMADLYRRRPGMLFGGAYWSVSPLAAAPETTACGLPVGCEDETEYFGAVDRLLLTRLLVTPPALPQIADVETCRYVTLRFLLSEPRLTFISIWNPSFLTLLMRALEEHAPRLIHDIGAGTLSPPASLPRVLHKTLARRLVPLPKRARLLDGVLKHHGKLFPREIWPSLAVISCWASASASRFVPELKRLFPGVEIQPKGLLATEGVVSLPLTGHPGTALAVTSHFLEFVDESNPSATPRLADELEVGDCYAAVLTTGGGLYRYALGDRLRVVGRVAATPLVEFIGRTGETSDLCGEKLDEARVREILNKVFNEFRIEPLFAMMAPEWGQPPSYRLFLEADGVSPATLEAIARRVEAQLLGEYHYAYCRRLGQLGPLTTSRAGKSAARIYLERCAAMGQRHGNIKPAVLHRETGWSEWFSHQGVLRLS